MVINCIDIELETDDEDVESRLAVKKRKKKGKRILGLRCGNICQKTFKPPENSQLIKCYYNLLILLSHEDMPLLLLFRSTGASHLELIFVSIQFSV